MKVTSELQRYLISVGFEDSQTRQKFLFPELTDHYDPFLADQMEEVVTKLRGALKKRRKILVWGDADLDGISSAALLKLALEDLGFDEVGVRIPSRDTEGFGLKPDEMRDFHQQGIELIVTVDVGITNVAEAALARQLGLDLIITDHHEITGDIPDTTIINPKMPASKYPWRELSGSGVVLKLVCALYERMVGMGVKELVRLRPHYWAFASLGTISDRCPLIDENRLIVRNGLTFLQSGGWPSLEVWLEEMGLQAESLTVFDLYSRGISAFYAIDAEEGVRLLLSDNQEYLHSRYAELKERAAAWQRGKQRMIDAAERTIRHTGGMVISISTDVGQDYLGTAAHALRERYGKPVIVIVPRKEQWHAECRGLERVNLLEYLSRFERFFLTFGGHRKACGFTLRPGTLDEFLAAVDAYPIQLPLSVDEEKAAFELAVTTDFTDWALLAPFGEGNLPPRLVARGVELSVSPDGYSVDRVPIYLPFSLRPLPKSEGRFDMEYTIKPDGAIRVLSLEPVD